MVAQILAFGLLRLQALVVRSGAARGVGEVGVERLVGLLALAVALAAGGLVGGLRRVLELVAGVRGLGGLRRFRRQLLGQFQQGIGFKCLDRKSVG